jgi:phospholipase A-2-activating protein
LNSNIELKLKKKLLFFKNLKIIKTIKAHSNSISSISVFPLGNLVSVSKDKSINIYDNNFNIIQTIINAHDSKITYVDVKDENNFVTCSNDKKIKIWIKKGKKFELGKIIKNTHNNYIYKVIYCLNGNIISCSEDSTIKLWEYSNLNNKFQCITVLKCNDKIKSILLLEEKNILISSGYGRADIFNKNSLKLLYTINNISCYSSNALKKLDDDKIIFGGGYDKIMKVLSLREKKNNKRNR